MVKGFSEQMVRLSKTSNVNIEYMKNLKYIKIKPG